MKIKIGEDFLKKKTVEITLAQTGKSQLGLKFERLAKHRKQFQELSKLVLILIVTSKV